jgi:Predicted acyltransferase
LQIIKTQRKLSYINFIKLKIYRRKVRLNWHIKKFDELNINELYEILKIRNNVFIVEQECPYLDCDGKDKSSYHIFCEEDGEIGAYLRVIEKGISFNEISIGRVLVNDKYRGKSLARKCMKMAIDFIENELKENSIRIEAQEYLTKFYKSLGFKEVSDIFLEDGIPHVEMLYIK